ncbi:MAG: hypothetical protein IJ733_12485 [Lachnospiraceae bacterium]|nr:hypothetical protein [Lachnospiraceae bacterium]
MAPAEVMVHDLLKNLEEEDYNAAISFIRYLSDSRKKDRQQKDRRIFEEINGMFEKDKGWESEEAMLRDMAEFRKERMGI